MRNAGGNSRRSVCKAHAMWAPRAPPSSPTPTSPHRPTPPPPNKEHGPTIPAMHDRGTQDKKAAPLRVICELGSHRGESQWGSHRGESQWGSTRREHQPRLCNTPESRCTLTLTSHVSPTGTSFSDLSGTGTHDIGARWNGKREGDLSGALGLHHHSLHFLPGRTRTKTAGSTCHGGRNQTMVGKRQTSMTRLRS